MLIKVSSFFCCWKYYQKFVLSKKHTKGFSSCLLYYSEYFKEIKMDHEGSSLDHADGHSTPRWLSAIASAGRPALGEDCLSQNCFIESAFPFFDDDDDFKSKVRKIVNWRLEGLYNEISLMWTLIMLSTGICVLKLPQSHITLYIVLDNGIHCS